MPGTPSHPGEANRAFTLVELLIVIGIIAVLIGILLPALGQARRSARAIVCMNNVRLLGVGMMVYMNDAQGVFPWDGYGEGDRQKRAVGYWNDPSLWSNAMLKGAGTPTYDQQQLDDLAGRRSLPKYGDRGLLVCPEVTAPIPVDGGDLVLDGYFLMWGWNPDYAPAVFPSTRKTFICYGYNTQLDNHVEDRNVSYRVTVKVSRVRNPSDTVIVVEKIMMPRETDPAFATSVCQSQVSWKEVSTRHSGGGYGLFADGHVNLLRHKDVNNPPGAPADYNQPGYAVWNPQGPAN